MYLCFYIYENNFELDFDTDSADGQIQILAEFDKY